MSRIPPLVGSIAGFGPVESPRASLKMIRINTTLHRHHIAEELRPTMVASIQAAADDYLLTKLMEEQGATRKEIHRHLKRLAKVEAELLDIFFGQAKEPAAAARVVGQHVAAMGAPGRDECRLAIDTLRQYLRAGAKFAGKAGAVKTEAPVVAIHRRQVRLAKAVSTWFYDADLPPAMSAASLMAQLLADVLDSVGEPHTKPDELLTAATYPEAPFRPTRRRGRKAKST